MAKRVDFEDTIDGLEAKIDAFFNDCESKGKMPTAELLCHALDLKMPRYRQLIKDYEASSGERNYSEIVKARDEAENPQYRHVRLLYRAKLRMSDAVSQRKDTVGIFLAKQDCYNGFSDTPAKSDIGEISLKIKLDGLPKGVTPGG